MGNIVGELTRTSTEAARVQALACVRYQIGHAEAKIARISAELQVKRVSIERSRQARGAIDAFRNVLQLSALVYMAQADVSELKNGRSRQRAAARCCFK